MAVTDDDITGASLLGMLASDVTSDDPIGNVCTTLGAVFNRSRKATHEAVKRERPEAFGGEPKQSEVFETEGEVVP